jgi:hypothetical protein
VEKTWAQVSEQKTERAYPTKYVYLKSTTVICPLVGIGTLRTPLPQANVPHPGGRGGEAHSPAGGGLGESQFRRLEKKLSTLPTLWSTLFNGSHKLESVSYRAFVKGSNKLILNYL